MGEAASGLHGANRLDGNSLIELLAFGRRLRPTRRGSGRSNAPRPR